jgi:sensor c-di-GMP phosphodiesterase-like protein
MAAPTSKSSANTSATGLAPTRTRRLRPAAVAWSLLLGLVLVLAGVAAGHFGADQLARQQAQNELDEASDRLSVRFDAIINEARTVFDELERLRLPTCSEQELLNMRNRLFDARFLRDIGRLENMTLYCSTALGHLTEPYLSSEADVNIAVDLGVKTDRAVLAGQGTRTMVIEGEHFNALVDPAVVTDLAAAMESATLFLRAYGENGGNWHPFQSGTELAHRGLSSERCSPDTGLCLLLHVSERRMFEGQSQARVAMAGFGGVAGLAVFLVIFIAVRQEESPEKRLRQALNKDWIHTVYQPIIRLPDHRLVGFEALARWKDDAGNEMPAEEFIALAERTGLIGRVSERIIRTIGRELSDWLKRNPDRVIAINIAPTELDDDALLEKLERELISRGVNPEQVMLEITERTMVENASAHERIEQLAHRGFRVYADDFGVGYCGLAYLNDMDVHGIKISHLFTAAVATDSPKAALVPRITELARELGLDVVIEGVETDAQARSLAELDPILVQGWLYSRGIAIDELIERFDGGDPNPSEKD